VRTDTGRCPGIPAGEARDFDNAEVPGLGQSDAMLLYWWHLVPAPEGGFRIDNLRTLAVGR
jgi:hypothetical protein